MYVVVEKLWGRAVWVSYPLVDRAVAEELAEELQDDAWTLDSTYHVWPAAD